MIERCPELEACEAVLSDALEGFSLIGEIPLSDEDAQHPEELLGQKVAGDLSRGARYLTTGTPTAFACILTWSGILRYQDGSYWPGVERAAGQRDVNWRGRATPRALSGRCGREIYSADRPAGATSLENAVVLCRETHRPEEVERLEQLMARIRAPQRRDHSCTEPAGRISGAAPLHGAAGSVAAPFWGGTPLESPSVNAAYIGTGRQ